MKKNTILSLLSLLLLAGSTYAQSASEAMRRAKNVHNYYIVDPVKHQDKLGDAQREIDIAVKDATYQKEAKAWILRGEIYNDIAIQLAAARKANQEAKDIPQIKDPAGTAFSSFAKALELAEKKTVIKEVMKNLQKVQPSLYTLGIFAYEDQNHELAYSNFSSLLETHKLLKKHQAESSLDEQKAYDEQLFLTGLAALNANRLDDAKRFFQKLLQNKYENPAVYEALYVIKKQQGGGSQAAAEAAYPYLEIGRSKFPDDLSLLFAEINHFLQVNELDALIGKLKMAIDKEPENFSLYLTLANVYDNLFQQATDSGEEETAKTHYRSAIQYYKKALTKKPDYVDAIYSIGALYFNKAAHKTKELSKIEGDTSQKGQQQYEEKRVEIFDLFDQALPYFKKAESLNPNNVNTLIALKEIYTRKDQPDLANAFEERLEKVQAGETVEAYFGE